MPKVCVEWEADDGDNGSGNNRLRTFTAVVGNGTQTEFNLNHGLGVREVALMAYDVNTGEVRTDYALFLDSENRATLRFDTAPAANAVRVYALGVAPR